MVAPSHPCVLLLSMHVNYLYLSAFIWSINSAGQLVTVMWLKFNIEINALLFQQRIRFYSDEAYDLLQLRELLIYVILTYSTTGINCD